MNKQRLLDLFFTIVQIESPSFHEAPMADFCARFLEELGFEVTFDDTAQITGCDSGNLIAKLPGTVPGHIAFSAHMDSVSPCAGIEPHITTMMIEGKDQEVICAKSPTILSADDKSGAAAILEALTTVVEEGRRRPDITVLFTVCEEKSLVGSNALAPDTFEGNVPCFVLDADGHPGTVIVAAPYHYSLRATLKGRACHAGVEPEKGISAIEMAADAITHMELGRIDECTTANIGIIRGGEARNVVCESCYLEGECRSIYEDRVLAQRDAMTCALESAAERFGGTVELDWRLDYPGILYAEDMPLIESLRRAAAAAGLDFELASSGGGADANVLGQKGALAITLGTGMANYHSLDEYISVQDLNDMARYVEAIIDEYANNFSA